MTYSTVPYVHEYYEASLNCNQESITDRKGDIITHSIILGFVTSLSLLITFKF